MKLRFVPNVPNFLTLVRFLAIPVLAYLIYAGDDHNFAAFLLFVGIWLTDMLDGFIARRFNRSPSSANCSTRLLTSFFS